MKTEWSFTKQQFETAPSDVLIDMLMNALTSNAVDALNALRREYGDSVDKMLKDTDSWYHILGHVEYEVRHLGGDDYAIYAKHDNEYRQLCSYDKTTKKVCPVFIEHVTDADSDEATQLNEEIVMNENKDEKEQIIPAPAMENNAQVNEKQDTLGTPVAIPDVQEILANSEVEYTPGETTERAKEISLNKFTPAQYLQMLFRIPFANWLDVRSYIWINDYPEAGFQLTGSIPVENVTIFDDYTFSILSMNDHKMFRILVAITDDDYGNPSYLSTHDVPNRWMFLSDITTGQGGCTPSALKPGTMMK